MAQVDLLSRVPGSSTIPYMNEQMMTRPDIPGASILEGIHILDGGLASELEYLGARIDGPLWSAHVLEDAPEKVVAVHRAFIEAGAECIATASYQVSRMGYAEIGLPPNAPTLRCSARSSWPGPRRGTFPVAEF